MSELLSYFQSQRDQMIETLTRLVEFETPTTHKEAVDKLGAHLEAEFRALGASSVTRFPIDGAGDVLLAKWNEDAPGKPIMFLIHIDTVWPLGTLAERPVTIDADGRLFGPGAIDMKGGITVVLSALRGLRDLGQMPNRPIWVLMTTDEEIGSIYSTPIIKDLAKQAGLVLVMEPATIDEALKTQRKGVATYRVDIEGLPSHAGNAPEKGINAITELAQQVLKIQSFNDLRRGVSVNVTMVEGGSATNVIPAHVTAFVDTRAITVAQWDETDEKVLGLTPFVPGAKVAVKRINGHTPMERNETMQRQYAQVQRIGAAQGLTIREDMSGGGSDGNSVAALGIPVLDGLGPQGDGLHALHEHVVLASLPRRSTLIAAMLKDWVCD
ncbi:MAG TPA: M20 family metallopeptidase [Candidatus Limnocylindrales bacterium]|nr:M20 family metallopeptidase [Candidatus Limnocylindrales bacterium]